MTADFKKVKAIVKPGKNIPGTERGKCKYPGAGCCEEQEGVHGDCSGQ